MMHEQEKTLYADREKIKIKKFGCSVKYFRTEDKE